MKNFQDFTKLYSLSKTLRFELKPIGKTLHHIEKGNFISHDQQRAGDYKQVKQLIDNYHRSHIDEKLAKFSFPYESNGSKNSLCEYYEYRKSDDKDTFTKIQENLRKQISQQLYVKKLFNKDLFTEILPRNISDDNDRAIVEKFKQFTTYFRGFHENRKNLYSKEAKSTAIAYRLIHENLPKFIDNMEIFDAIKEIPEIAENIQQLNDDFRSRLNIGNIADAFKLQYFNSTLTQAQITLYNAIIGGISEGDHKIQGLNEYINLYNQQHEKAHISKFKVLYKQILSDREHLSWLPEQFDNDNELLSAIKAYYDTTSAALYNLKVLLESIGSYDLNGIFLTNGPQLALLSNRVCGKRALSIEQSLKAALMQKRKQKKKEDTETYEKALNALYKKQKSFSLGDINRATGLQIEQYFAKFGADDGDENLFTRIDRTYTEIAPLFQKHYPEQQKLIQNKDDIANIKSFLDALLALLHFVKPLLGTGEESNKENRFYGELMPIWEQLNSLIPLYNMVRNYATQKPYSTKKIKLNFENSQLLNGWDKNKEKENLSVILRKDGMYYLGIINKDNKQILEEFPTNGECYEKLVYKQIPITSGIGGFIRKCGGTAKKYGWVCPASCINSQEQIIINDKEAKENLTAIIDCQKDFFDKYEKDGFKYSEYGFRFKESKDYEKLSDFYKDIEEQRYKVMFQPISADYIHALVKEGKLYLFQIYNKDFSEHSKGTPNLHTLYWKMLFDERNLANVVYKLDGGAEMFYRERSITCNKPTHPKNVAIKNKNPQNSKPESRFTYDITKDRRYTVDKFLFHVPLTLNFKSKGQDDINAQVRSYIHSADDLHVIGIDRGERNLLYLVVVDAKGRICEQLSLNEIYNTHNGTTYHTDYHLLLDNREQERKRERHSWQTIEGIKELKEGYMSQVIHKVAELMIKYKAIVVLEDLNMGFMRSRQRVEKSVYQKFEKMLIDKLNYLVDKKADPVQSGGLLNAYQLTSKLKSFDKLGKQSGFLFYVPAWNTSKIDPTTGFVNLLDLRYESEEKAKELLGKFDAIRYNRDEDWFEFEIDYDQFTTKAQGSRTQWTICTYGERIETFRNPEMAQWDSREVNLTQKFKALFEGLNIDGDLKEVILQQHGKTFFKPLLHLLHLTLQLRNSRTGTDTDYILSPVANGNGVFFDSRNSDGSLPQDADANGAYNIARKGLMLIEQIKRSDNPEKVDLHLTNKSWLQYAQQKQ